MTGPPATSFRGVAFCHVPADEPIRLEKLVSADGANDRWNRPGEPTVYLATELAIALAELARQLELSPRDDPVRRRLLGLALDVDGLVDLRRADIRAAVGAPDPVVSLCAPVSCASSLSPPCVATLRGRRAFQVRKTEVRPGRALPRAGTRRHNRESLRRARPCGAFACRRQD